MIKLDNNIKNRKDVDMTNDTLTYNINPCGACLGAFITNIDLTAKILSDGMVYRGKIQGLINLFIYKS